VRLLVVDDDPLSSALLAHLASLLGHVATIQNEPRRAVEMALSGDFDVLLLDLGMPQLDGFEALRLLREREARADRKPLAVVAVTGYASDADRLRCLAAGFNEHLTKPVQAASLTAAIEHVLGEANAAGSAPTRDSDAARLRATVRRLREVKPDDRAFAPTVTESFALRSAQLIEALRDALRERDGEAVSRAARALKSSAEFLGAMRLASMSAELEQLAERTLWEQADAQLAAINNEQQAVLTLLFESSRG
jgi:CheY-like chemotaxis protein